MKDWGLKIEKKQSILSSTKGGEKQLTKALELKD
jgi:hypothetical protein